MVLRSPKFPTSLINFKQIHLDEEFAVFSINANSGLLQPNETKTAILTFSPPYPINYYKKVTILVHDQVMRSDLKICFEHSFYPDLSD